MDETGRRRRTIRGLLRLAVTIPPVALGTGLMSVTIAGRMAKVILFLGLIGWGWSETVFGPTGRLLVGGLFGTVGAVIAGHRIRRVFREGLLAEPATMISRTHEPDPDDHRERQVEPIVERRCQELGLAVPAVRIRDEVDPLCYSVRYPVETPPMQLLEADLDLVDDWTGAFPEGDADDWTDPIPEEHVLVVSSGLFQALDEDQLRGVLAHEVAHLRNDDLRLVNWLLFPVFWAEELIDVDLEASRHNSTTAFLINWLTYYTGRVTRFVTELGIGVFSRGREYAADAGGAQLTGDPAALATALERLEARIDGSPDEDLRAVAVVNVLPSTENGRHRLHATHPPTERRIERLREMVVAQVT